MKRFNSPSKFRIHYYIRLVFCSAALILSVLLWLFAREQFALMEDFKFFDCFSFFHIIWLLWMVDMFTQLLPARHYWPVGSQKFLEYAFRPVAGATSGEGFGRFLRQSQHEVLAVALVWLALVFSIGTLYFMKIIDQTVLLLISMVFYLCDVICVLFWCPFRVFLMKNRCCKTCRIFNWDHMMMFSPLIFVPGFFTWSLCLMSLIVLAVWEWNFIRHPKRFWEGSNSALGCTTCDDILCGGHLRAYPAATKSAKHGKGV